MYCGLSLIGGTALLIALCPKPAIYGDLGFSVAVEDRNGQLLGLGLADDDRYRLKVPLDDIAPTAIDATLLYEDRYFFAHPGVNPAALVRAAWTTYFRPNRVMGASTITMQLARLRFSLNTRSIGGKLLQIARAIQLERHYTKSEILEAYLNMAPYGGNVEGIGTASRIYFDKPASQLSLPEALALAVIPQNPARRNPATTAGYAMMSAARSRLVGQWEQKFDLPDETKLQFGLRLTVRTRQDLPSFAPHFARDVAAGDLPRSVLRRATLDLSMQRTLESHIEDYVDRRRQDGINNASAMLIDFRTMEVLAAVGSSDFFDDRIGGQVNGMRAKRSPGSTLKPFLYGLAIDGGLIHPKTLLKDAPRRFAAYAPENFDRGFMGPVMAQDALIYSRNVPAIDLLSRIGHDNFHNFLLAGEVSRLRDADHYGLALILGGIELTMEELVRLYAMLANGGQLKPLVKTINNDQIVASKRLLSPEASFLVLDMLRQNPRPDALFMNSNTGRAAVAWKTGTSYAFRDAWTVGVVGPYVLAVWIGNFDGSSNAEFIGRQAAAPLFFAISDALASRIPESYANMQPSQGMNLRKIDVCASTGDLPGKYCPRTEESWFVPGVSPIKVSSVHRPVYIDIETGMRACSFDSERTRKEVFEFWPSDILRVYQAAGIAIRKPPHWSPACPLEFLASTGLPPKITSLSESVVYYMRSDRLAEERLPLIATTDADASWLYWFVDDKFVGKSRNSDPLMWNPITGIHNVLAVDDLGRSDSQQLSVALAN